MRHPPRPQTGAITPYEARSIARALLVKAAKQRAPHAILFHDGSFLIRRLTPAHRTQWPEWWNDQFRFVLVGIYDLRANLEDITADILDTHQADHAPPRIKKHPLGG